MLHAKGWGCSFGNADFASTVTRNVFRQRGFMYLYFMYLSVLFPLISFFLSFCFIHDPVKYGSTVSTKTDIIIWDYYYMWSHKKIHCQISVLYAVYSLVFPFKVTFITYWALYRVKCLTVKLMQLSACAMDDLLTEYEWVLNSSYLLTHNDWLTD